MEPYTSIEKKDSISYKDFVEQHVKTGIPVVLKNASSAWKSNLIFTPDFFREKFGNYETSSGGKTYTMTDILEITEKSTPENPAPYPIHFQIPKQLPELMEMLNPIHMNIAQPNWFRSNFIPYGKFGNTVHLFIGGRGNQYGLHKDFFHTNAWITQLYGEKKFIVFPGDQDEYLYVGKESFSRFLSPVDFINPDYEKYPKFKHAKPIDVTLQPGETIYIPNGTWHSTVAYSQNISLIVDQLNGYNYPAWKKDIYDLKKESSKLKAMMQYGYAFSTGTACKIAELVGKMF